MIEDQEGLLVLSILAIALVAIYAAAHGRDKLMMASIILIMVAIFGYHWYQANP